MELFKEVSSGIRPLDQEKMKAARARVDNLTKPVGSLGRLEDIAVQLSGITGEMFSQVDRKTLIVMAADNGVYDEGVAAYPQEVTGIIARCMIQGIAGVSVFARLWGVNLNVIDVGIKGEEELKGVENRKIMHGTGNMVKGPAMSREQAVKAIETGIQAVFEAVEGGSGIIATGEVGIGNTTTSSAVLSVLENVSPREVTGRGAGLDDMGLEQKIRTIEKAIEINEPDREDVVDVLSKVGGLDIAGMVGIYLGAAYKRVPVVIDGFISSVAALAACRLNPLAHGYMFPSHRSAEKAGDLVMERLGFKPYLDMQMRLGEGSGAIIAMQIIEAAARMMQDMKTFDEIGIARQSG
ncbi:MAG: Nicotinate-nucleotide--dimethylbenzimidazole phosphoribosyltransferase [Firmicutes bacterium]|nr:Nicotinate-nucleotide--dimethylbenzimidazole phosphoribosyltransferase [Bacillota bacterium]MDI6706902.1 nicotinate-nucleotide--dimethylbenzimidazole phosphoribosyltransferase [Bacillota bacterium]